MRYYKIADILFKIEGDWSDFAEERMKAYAVAPPSGGAYDVCCRIEQECDDIPMPNAESSVEVNARHFMHLAGGGFAIVDWIPAFSPKILNCIEANSDWSEVSVRLCREDFSGLDKNRRVFYALGEVFVYALMVRGGGTLHASAVLYKDQALLFSAPSGTGKSTQTGLWRKYYPDDTRMINDDTPALRAKYDENGELRMCAYGTPWAGTSGINSNISAPVRAVVFLEQAPENSLRPVSGAEAAVALMYESRIVALEEFMQRSLDLSARLLELVPAYRLACTISREAVELVKNELF